MAAAPPQQFCVRWNSYHTNLQAVFPRLLLTEQFADVTLACESRQLRCHKLVLSACSAYLEQLLLQNPCKHPIVLMRDMRFSEMQALVDFMYKGEVNVTQEELPSLLKSAEALQIRGLCSSEAPVGTEGAGTDYTVASEALVAHAQSTTTNGQSPSPPKPSTPSKKRRDEPAVKEETVEEDGLYYGELEPDQLEYNEDEEPSKPGSSLGQTSDTDYAIANVQCQYDSPEGEETSDAEPTRHGRTDDHNYDTRNEPPAFVIQQMNNSVQVESVPPCGSRPKMMTIHPGQAPYVSVLRPESQPSEYAINKRIRRSEAVLRQAADCVSRGSTFQTVSEQFNIPISTIRFFMARKGILPQRRRGRSTQSVIRPSSPEPPYHMQHYKLPAVLLRLDGDDA